MSLPLDASGAARNVLRDLKSDAATQPIFDALAARITALRNDPGDPHLRGTVSRVLGDQTVRVALVWVGAPTNQQWGLAWTVTETAEGSCLTILHIELVAS